MKLTHLSLFSGIGGLDLAAEWAGFETVAQCEWADYPTKILEKHWPDVPRWRDIRDVTADEFYIRTGRRTVDVISGGFPCQPFSVAGNQKGKEDDRYLWPEMLRVIREIKPTWVLGENVPGIIKLAGRTVCEDLEREGYSVAVFNFEAAAVGAPHRRERAFFVGNTKHDGFSSCTFNRSNIKNAKESAERQKQTEQFEGTSRYRHNEVMADTPIERKRGVPVQSRQSRQTSIDVNGGSQDIPYTESELPQTGIGTNETGITGFTNSGNVCNSASAGLQNRTDVTMGGQRQEPQSKRPDGGSTEPGLGGMADGLPVGMDGIITFIPEPDIARVATGVKNRVDRLKCLGNAVVPQQAYPIFRAIAEIERDYI